MVDFWRPAPYSDPSTEYQGLTQSFVSSQVIKPERGRRHFSSAEAPTAGANLRCRAVSGQPTEARTALLLKSARRVITTNRHEVVSTARATLD